MKRGVLMRTLTLLTIMMLINSTALADSVHVEQTLESPFLTLQLNADVEVPDEGVQLSIYESDYARADATAWAEMAAPGDASAPGAVLISGWDIKYEGEASSFNYISSESRFDLRYGNIDVPIWWSYAQKDVQATNIDITPQQAKDAAQGVVDRLAQTLGWDGYSFSACYAMPAAQDIPDISPNAIMPDNMYDASKGYYIVEYTHDVGGLSIAYDKSPMLDELYADIYADVLQIYVIDSGIILVEGWYRVFTETGTEPLNVSLDEAIQVLADNMDYVECYPDEAVCEISEIGLCYRLVQTRPTYDPSAGVCMSVRPAWRFASRISRSESNVFFMFVDAVTGEVLP